MCGYQVNGNIMTIIRIATRQSALALWQANHIKTLLEENTSVRCEIIGMTTEGDRNKVSPLKLMGGKGVFVKELETALLDDRVGSADIAVHSMKDVPGELPPGLEIAAMVERANPRDAFVSNNFETLEAMPDGARVGSSSLRRVLQTKAAFPGLNFIELRGNVDTRLRKLDEENYEAVILAVAGLQRLGFGDRVRQEIPTTLCIPAAGQGAVGVECRSNNESIKVLLAGISHQETFDCVSAERQVTRLLGATCNLPVAVFAERKGSECLIRGYVANESGDKVVQESVSALVGSEKSAAQILGQKLLDAGAADLIRSQQ
jgi:hydroxymethylbilane synthase